MGSLSQTLFLMASPLLLLPLLLPASCLGFRPPSCTDGSLSSCLCGDGSEPDFSGQNFPCPIKKGVPRPSCKCPPGAELLSKYKVKLPRRPCSKGRPACADKSEVFNLKCEGGGVPSVEVGKYPRCSSGRLLCQDEQPLKCLVEGQLTEEEPNFI